MDNVHYCPNEDDEDLLYPNEEEDYDYDEVENDERSGVVRPRGHDHHFCRARGHNGKVAAQLTSGYGFPAFGITYPKNKSSLYRYATECIVANILKVYPLSDRTLGELPWIAYSRAQDAYQVSPVYGNISYSALKTVMDQLISGAYVEHELGRHGLYCNYRSRFRPTQKCLDALGAAVGVLSKDGHALLADGSSVVDESTLPAIVDSRMGWSFHRQQGDKDKLVVSIDEANTAKLTALNKAIAASGWELGGGLSLEAIQYFQVQILTYDNANAGGRIYAPAQGIAAKLRPEWVMQGEACDEVDIKSSHSSIFYSLEGGEAPDDCYTLLDLTPEENRKYRPYIKRAMNIAFNAKSVDATRRTLVDQAAEAAKSSDDKSQAFLKAYNEYNDNAKRNEEIKSKCRASTVGILDLLGRLRATHPLIDDRFCSNAGVVAMGYEGKLALSVLERCVAEDLAVLNIHDGYVAPKSRIERLKEIVADELVKLGIKAALEVKTIGKPAPESTESAVVPVAEPAPTKNASVEAVPAPLSVLNVARNDDLDFGDLYADPADLIRRMTATPSEARGRRVHMT